MRKLVGHLLVATRACRLLRLRTSVGTLGFSPSSIAIELWVDPGARGADVAFVRTCLREGDVAVDVGANIGHLSLAMARAVGATGTVVAVEPHPRTAEHLRRNVARNGLGQVRVVEAAVGASPGRVHVTDRGSDDQNQVAPSGPEVAQVSLDDVLEDMSVVRLLKVDVEGYELEVLRGAGRTLERTEVVFVELEEPLLGQFGGSAHDVAQSLEDAGLHHHGRWTENGLVGGRDGDGFESGNHVFARDGWPGPLAP